MKRNRRLGKTGMGLLAVCMLMLGCRGYASYWIETSVENQTGQAVHELEVDYPTASFGADNLAPGAVMHYRFKVRGNGPVNVAYNLSDGKAVHAQGLTLAEKERGQLTIRLLPLGKVEFVPSLRSGS